MASGIASSPTRSPAASATAPMTGGAARIAMRSMVPTTVSPVPGARPGSASACRMLAGISVPMPRPITPKAATVASGDEVASAAAVASPPTAAPARATARSPKRVTAGSPSSRPTVWQVCSAMKPRPPTAAAAPRSSRRYSALHAAPTSSTDCAQAATVPSAARLRTSRRPSGRRSGDGTRPPACAGGTGGRSASSGPGSSRRRTTTGTTASSPAATARWTTTGAPRATASEPIAAPVTAPMLQTACSEFRIDRP